MNSRKSQAVICVQNSEITEFLLLKTTMARGEFWQNVTGHAHQGESTKLCALREAEEETALAHSNIKKVIKLFQHKFTRQDLVFTEDVFLLICEQKWQVKLDPHEHEFFRWIKAHDIIPEMVKYPSNQQALLMARDFL